jgi:hypothetical protein
MKKITFLFVFLISFLLFSCEKPAVEDMNPQTETPTTPPAVVKVEFTAVASNVTVYNGTDGKITVTVTAGTAPYTYQIGSEAAQSTNVFSGLKVGSYNITVVDSKSQTLSKAVEITQPALVSLAFTVSGTNISAWSLSDGTINVTVTSGMPPYTYSIENGASNNTGVFSGLKAGSYNVKTTDSQNQTATKSITLTEPRIVALYTRNLIDLTSYTTISSYLPPLSTTITETSAQASVFEGRKKFSVSFWYNTAGNLNKFQTTSSTARLFTVRSDSPNGEYMFIDLNKSFIQYTRYNGTPTATIKYNSTTAWTGKHHIVITYDGSEMKMYVDNILAGSQITDINIFSNTVMFGNSTTSSNSQFWAYAGVISSIKIFNNAIDLAEVNNLFNNL